MNSRSVLFASCDFVTSNNNVNKKKERKEETHEQE